MWVLGRVAWATVGGTPTLGQGCPQHSAASFSLTRLLLSRGEFWELADQPRGLLVVGPQGEDAVVGRAGALLTGR